MQRWGASGFIPTMPARPEDLDLLPLTVATARKVQRDRIQFASTRYVSPVLAAYSGEQVTLSYDPRDIKENPCLLQRWVPLPGHRTGTGGRSHHPRATCARPGQTGGASSSSCCEIDAALPIPSPATPATHRSSRRSPSCPQPAQLSRAGRTELLTIDEVDRLKVTGLEQVRDYYDRHAMGLILMGMSGIEKRLARYPQLYRRVGFAHEYRQLSPEELTAVLAHACRPDPRTPRTGPENSEDILAHITAIATIVRMTGGNFRLVDRLLTQIRRIQTLYGLDSFTPETVDAAREALLIGH